MLNLFPIQWLALMAYFILRVFVGLSLLFLGRRHIFAYRELVETTRWPLFAYKPFPIVAFIIAEFVIGIMITLGVATQIAALCLCGLSIKMLWWRGRFTHDSIPSRLVYVLYLGCALSLFITGAGAFAFDLPI